MLERLEDYQAIKREHRQLQSYKEKLLAKYDELLDSQAKEMLAIEEAIDGLDPTSRTLLRYHYIDGMKWDTVCDRMNYSRRSIFNLRAKALEQLEQLKREEPGE